MDNAINLALIAAFVAMLATMGVVSNTCFGSCSVCDSPCDRNSGHSGACRCPEHN
jgi:hypothetical protein